MTEFTPLRRSALTSLFFMVSALAQNPPNPPANPASQQQPARLAANVIEAIEFRGLRRMPQDTVRVILVSKAGDVYDDKILHNDLTALWNTDRFSDIQVEKEAGKRGGMIVRFVVNERPVR